MAYSFNSYGNGYSRAPYKHSSGYGRRSYSRQSSGYGSSKPKKHSGARFVEHSKNGKPVITAWNYSRRLGLVKILIAPYHGSKKVKSKSGREWSAWMAKIEGPGFSENFPVLVDFSRRMAVIRKYGWVVKPSAPNGGYCGSFTKKTKYEKFCI